MKRENQFDEVMIVNPSQGRTNSEQRVRLMRFHNTLPPELSGFAEPDPYGYYAEPEPYGYYGEVDPPMGYYGQVDPTYGYYGEVEPAMGYYGQVDPAYGTTCRLLDDASAPMLQQHLGVRHGERVLDLEPPQRRPARLDGEDRAPPILDAHAHRARSIEIQIGLANAGPRDGVPPPAVANDEETALDLVLHRLARGLVNAGRIGGESHRQKR